MSRCHNITVDGRKVHIPGCMGCAAMGHHRCTCSPQERTPKQERDIMDVLKSIERRLTHLEARRAPEPPAKGSHPHETPRLPQ